MADVREQITLKPKCLKDNPKPHTFSNQGVLLPCCWVDRYDHRALDPEVDALFREHLKVENNDNLDDIFESEEWTHFFDLLENDPANAPKTCYKYCGEYGDPTEGWKIPIKDITSEQPQAGCAHGVKVILK